MASLVLVACGGQPGGVVPVGTKVQPVPEQPVAAKPEVAPSSETMERDARKTTAGGATFVAPAGWTLRSARAGVLLDGPESDVHVAIVETEETTADAAVAAAWASVHPDFRRTVDVAVDRPGRNGWDQQRNYEYETSPNEKLVLRATARRRGRTWTVVLVDGTEAGHGRRQAQMEIIRDSLRPQGYEHESFKGKTAHTLDAGRIAQLTKFIEQGRDMAGVPGMAISLVQGGKVVFEGGFGVRELGKPARVDADTLFMIASNTKALSTLLLAKLVDEGKFDWNSPVIDVYPDFKLGDAETTRSVQMKHLVCACTGLPRQDAEWFFEFKNSTAASTMKVLGIMQPTTKFGETYQYSNPLAAAAGFVGGYAAYPNRELGAAYDEAMRTRVFQPLRMTSTTFDFARALRANHASPYAEDLHGAPARTSMAINAAVFPIRPAGAAWSSARDLTRYVQLELAKGTLPDGSRYVSEKNLLARREKQVASSEFRLYGMGLETNTQYDTPVVEHGGSMIGFKSNMFWLPEHGVGGVILTSSDSGALVHVAYLRKVLEVLFDGRPEADEDLAFAVKARKERLAKANARLVVPPAAATVAGLAKRYGNPALGDIAIVTKGKAVFVDAGEWKVPMATRTNDDGTTSLVSIEPGFDIDFVIAEREGKRALVMPDVQREYAFIEK
ncbi:beta-lactamase family protein [Pendulispora brunnea]|uniref:Beta-lactamase family protein n=1 Tax=Pendulispora brunnea TaxID=2905690 RepID=A0ABZ2KLK9_9BACT